MVYLTILKNDGVRQWEGWHPIYEMEHESHVWNHQPDIHSGNVTWLAGNSSLWKVVGEIIKMSELYRPDKPSSGICQMASPYYNPTMKQGVGYSANPNESPARKSTPPETLMSSLWVETRLVVGNAIDSFTSCGECAATWFTWGYPNFVQQTQNLTAII